MPMVRDKAKRWRQTRRKRRETERMSWRRRINSRERESGCISPSSHNERYAGSLSFSLRIPMWEQIINWIRSLTLKDGGNLKRKKKMKRQLSIWITCTVGDEEVREKKKKEEAEMRSHEGERERGVYEVMGWRWGGITAIWIGERRIIECGVKK